MEAVRHFPRKAAHIRARPDRWPELTGVEHFLFVIVTADPWWPPGHIQDVIAGELGDQGTTVEPYHLLSIDDLESITALAAGGVRISDVLRERIGTGRQGDFLEPRVYEIAKERGVSLRNKVVHQAREAFLSTVAPT
jgi:hypothetical protein